MRYIWNFLLILVFLLIPVYSFGAYEKCFDITAKKIEYFYKIGLVIAKGDVVVNGEDLVIWAQEIRYEIKTEYVSLKDFKIFDLKNEAITEGKRGFLDLRNKEIWADRVFIFFKKEQIRIKAEGFHKNALNEYFAKKALITTCEFDCENEKYFPPWSLEIDNFVLTPEGVSSGSATKIRIKKIPILYLPRVAYIPKVKVPLTVPRKSGFLTPKLSLSSRLGLGLQLPLFLDFTDQIDFTLAPFYLTKRGILIDVENQFKFKKGFQGLIKLRYIKDKGKEEYPSDEKPEKNKWWFVGKVDYIVNSNFDMHLDMDLVSQKNFLEEFDVGEGGYTNVKNLFLQRFSRDIEDKSQEYRTSKFWIQYYRGSFYGRWENTYFDYHGSADKDTILQPYLKLKLNFLPFSVFGTILPEASFKYLYSYRKEGYYGDKVDTRIGLTYPFKIGMLFNSASVCYNLSFYNLREKENFKDKNIQRDYIEFSFNSYFALYKYYRLLGIFDKHLTFLHTVKPYITYFYRSKPSEIENPEFDYQDLISEKTQTIEYGLWQYFSLPEHVNFLILRTYQQYDFTKSERSVTATKPEEKPFSDVFMQIMLNWSPYISTRYDTSYNFYGLGFKKHSLTLSLKNFYFDSVDLTYQEDSAWNTRQITFDINSHILSKLLVQFYISRNLIQNENTEIRFVGTYLHKCYTLGFGVSVTPEDTKVYFLFRLIGLGGIEREIE